MKDFQQCPYYKNDYRVKTTQGFQKRLPYQSGYWWCEHPDSLYPYATKTGFNQRSSDRCKGNLIDCPYSNKFNK